MKNLIEALNIFLSHGDIKYPINCSHEEMAICGYDIYSFSKEEITRLKELGFEYNDEEEYFYSFLYGSC